MRASIVFRSLVSCLILATIAVLPVPSIAAPPAFRMKALPELPGLESAALCGASDSVKGVWVGGWSKNSAGDENAVAWRAPDLDTAPVISVLDPLVSRAEGIFVDPSTDCTAVYLCGHEFVTPGLVKPVGWRVPGAGPSAQFNLPTLAGGEGNARGFVSSASGAAAGPYVIVGSSLDAALVRKAATWQKDGNGAWTIEELPHPTIASAGDALDGMAMDESTFVVVGFADNVAGQMRPQVWERVGAGPWTRTEAPLLAGGVTGAVTSTCSAPDILLPPRVAGWSADGAGLRTAVQWEETLPGVWEVTSLGTLQGSAQSEAAGLFLIPLVGFGSSYTSAPEIDGLATLWEVNGATTTAYDLNALVVGQRPLGAFVARPSQSLAITAPWTERCVIANAMADGKSPGASKSGSGVATQHAVLLIPSITFSASATIGCADTTYDGLNVVVTGPSTVLTIDCEHRFASLSIQNGARVTHTAAQTQGMSLFIDGTPGDLTIAAGCSLTVKGRGYPFGQGPGAGVGGAVRGGGGGHAGAGGASSTASPGGATYGSITAPADLGSGGGSPRGGAGGGAIRLSVDGTFTIDGVLCANGDAGTVGGGNSGGGGSGGSIQVVAGTVTGSGTISANGGAGGADAGNAGGGGGGGRMTIEGGGWTFTGTRTACGGASANGGEHGGAGTILELNSLTELVSALGYGTAHAEPRARAGWIKASFIDNCGLVGPAARTDVTCAGPCSLDADVFVSGNAVLSAPQGQTLDLVIAGDLTIESGSSVSVNGRGFAPGQGPGAGVPGANQGGGGGYAGRGGTGGAGSPGGLTYGSVTAPWSEGAFGSGGGSTLRGGAGGGAIHLVVGGTCTVDGVLSANGDDGRTGGGAQGGGGSGGSVWLEAGTLAGAGTISANGGAGGVSGGAAGGGGGGGRLALVISYEWDFDYNGLLTTCGGASGASAERGGAGTIYRVAPGEPDQLVIDNCGNAGAATELTGPIALSADVLVTGLAKLSPAGAIPLEVYVWPERDFTLDTGSSIEANGAGFAGGVGPGAGQSGPTGQRGGGAGHGGAGGASSTGLPGGAPYGNPIMPVDLGSGGGNVNGVNGGRGGGAIRIEAANVTLNGPLNARGANAGTGGGGGAGGSIFVRTGGLAGSTALSVRGGNGNGGGGGGAGGRIYVERGAIGGPAMYADATCSTVVTLAEIDGGSGFVTGEIGTYNCVLSGTDVGEPGDRDGDGLPDAGDAGATPPARLSLAARSANPTRGAITLRFGLPVNAMARLAIYDVSGRWLAELVDAPLAAGWHAAEWDARDHAGRAIAPGVYFARLSAGDENATWRITLLR
ncbi:MAG: hypothetical protein ACKVU1_07220 [bacterium]